MIIAGHAFNLAGWCACGRRWTQIRNVGRECVGLEGIAHTGALNEAEASQIAAAREAEDARIADAMAGVAAGAGR